MTAACVLGWLLAGLAVIGGVWTWWFAGFAALYSEQAADYFGEGLTVALLELLAAPALVAGGVLLVTGRGRRVLLAASAAVLALAAYWPVRAATGIFVPSDARVHVVAALVYAGLAATVAGLALSASAGRWLEGSRASRLGARTR